VDLKQLLGCFEDAIWVLVLRQIPRLFHVTCLDIKVLLCDPVLDVLTVECSKLVDTKKWIENR
jgi:hypothetical protein